ncbi:MAG: hypothetical protein EXQ57_09810 [Bryobacterales bacterium]|nr:hypothetical protein [Bryobacterales bacterium]
MTPADLYLQAVINRHRASDDDNTPHRIRRQLIPLLRSWACPNLESVTLSGSIPKGTALRTSDVDLFLSLKPETLGPLSEIHTSLAAHFRDYLPRPRNVSLRIQFQNRSIDLVPARRRPNSTTHTLWQQRHHTWLRTDIEEQIRHVRNSGLQNEIQALKIWRKRNTLRFPSFLLELTAIRALKPNPSISQSFLSLLHFLATDFPTATLPDPANSNNIVSALLTQEEKQRIATTAEMSLRASSWPEIL